MSDLLKLPVSAVTADGELLKVSSVHAVAELFPYLEGDDYADLVRSIKEQGQHTPIVIFGDVLLDGRNRLRACVNAGVKPVAVAYDGADPDAFALSVNLDRRHLSKGQRAMIAALACSETEQSSRSMAKSTGVALGRIGQASTVIQFCPTGTSWVPAEQGASARPRPAARYERHPQRPLVRGTRTPQRVRGRTRMNVTATVDGREFISAEAGK